MNTDPMSIAHKWHDVAERVYTDSYQRDDPLANRFIHRVYAHFGTRIVGSLRREDVHSVATVEAMNEYEMIRSSPECVRCGGPILPNQSAALGDDDAVRHSDHSECW